MMKRKDGKPLITQLVFIIGILIVGITLILLTWWETNQNLNQQMEAYEKTQREILHMLVSLSVDDLSEEESADAAAVCAQMVENIKQGYPTSSTSFCYVAHNDRIMFLRDERSASEIVDMKRIDILNTYEKQYLITEEKVSTGEDLCYLGIVTADENIVSQMGLESLKVHVEMYIVLIVALASAMVSLTFGKMVKTNKSKAKLEQTVKENRNVIDELLTKNDELQHFDPTLHAYGIVSERFWTSVAEDLTEEQRQKCLRMQISYTKECGIQLAAVLERSMNKRFIGCHFSPMKFELLLLRTGREEAERYAKFLLERMEAEFGIANEILQITITDFDLTEDGI